LLPVAASTPPVAASTPPVGIAVGEGLGLAVTATTVKGSQVLFDRVNNAVLSLV
jgi:hypothetical protein